MLSKFPEHNSELNSFGLINKCFPRRHPNPRAARRFYTSHTAAVGGKHVCMAGRALKMWKLQEKEKRDTNENLINAVLFSDNSSGVTRLKPLH